MSIILTINEDDALSAEHRACLDGLTASGGSVLPNKKAGFLNVASGGSRVTVVGPPLVAKWGVSTEFEGSSSKPSVQASIPDHTGKNAAFYEFSNLLSQKLLKLAQKEAKKFVVKKDLQNDPQKVAGAFKKVVKENAKVDDSTDQVIKTYDPSVRLKIDVVKNAGGGEVDFTNPASWKIEVCDVNMEALPISKLVGKNITFVPRFEVRGLMSTQPGISPQLVLQGAIVLERSAPTNSSANWGSCKILMPRAKKQRVASNDEEEVDDESS